MIENINLKARILLPLALVLAALLGAFHYSLYQHEEHEIIRDFATSLKSTEAFYQRALQRRGNKLGAALEFVRHDESLRAALRAKNRDALMQRTGPLFEQLRARYHITHFYFTDAARVNLLRVHQPERFGDTINRNTTLAAEKTGETSIGAELGPLGTFTLRAVAPLSDNNERIGYVELGAEIEDILEDLQRVIGVDHVLLIDKQFLVREDWENGMRMLGREADWHKLPNMAISHQTVNLPSEQLTRLLSSPGQPDRSMEITVGGNRYQGGTIPLMDMKGKQVGYFAILRDTTQIHNTMYATSAALSIFSLVLGGMLIGLFYAITKRTERRLDNAYLRLAQQGQEREAMQERHIGELEVERDKLRRSQEELQKNEKKLLLAGKVFDNSTEGIMITDARGHILQVNRAFIAITGYSEADAIGQTPRLLRSDRHDDAFYQAMWDALAEFGYWQGEIWNRRRNGEIYPQWLSLIAIRDEQGETLNYLSVFADLTDKKQSDARAHHLAHYDPLTELPNRLMLEERLKQALASAQKENQLVALLYLDLDRFKAINDTLGYPVGDKLLQAVAERLAGQIRDSDTIARFSGDEFTIELSNVGSPQNAEMVAKKALNALVEPFNLGQHEIFLTASIGIALSPTDAGSMDEMIQHADTAMSHAKAQGGNCYHFYSADMNAMAAQRLSMESQLRKALNRNEFVLYYQPQICLHTDSIVGMEALIRWQHPERGLVPPVEFIPLLEATGLIVPVGEWVLRTACAQNSAWQAAGLPPVSVAVNLSARQFHQSDLAAMIKHALQDAELAPGYLELEITESILIQNLQATLATLNHLDLLGIRISIDDFGTGYSSLSYLKRLPISKIKIDKSFIHDICTDPDDEAIANAVISLGHSMQMEVIAEGVETQEQLERLRAQGCDKIQGYYYSRPLPADEIASLFGQELLKSGKP